MDDILHQCFRKIKVGKPIKNIEIDELLKQKSKLKIIISKNISQDEKLKAEKKLNQTEEKLSNLSSIINLKIVAEHLKSLEDNGGKFSQTGMWRLKTKLYGKI